MEVKLSSRLCWLVHLPVDGPSSFYAVSDLMSFVLSIKRDVLSLLGNIDTKEVQGAPRVGLYYQTSLFVYSSIVEPTVFSNIWTGMSFSGVLFYLHVSSKWSSRSDSIIALEFFLLMWIFKSPFSSQLWEFLFRSHTTRLVLIMTCLEQTRKSSLEGFCK